MNETFDLVPIWTLILALAVFLYVLLDGFDLGVGMLYGLAPDTRSRNTIMNSIAPIWDEQRDVAHPWRPRPSCRVSARLRNHNSSRLFPDPAHVTRARVSRRRL